jgi:hypothetical protein
VSATNPQPMLFDPIHRRRAQSPPFQPHSATSRDAAVEISPRAATLRESVLNYLRSHPAGLTDEEIQDGLAMPSSTERPRRIECVAAGLVRDSGTVRKTRSGRKAVVWVAT